MPKKSGPVSPQALRAWLVTTFIALLSLCVPALVYAKYLKVKELKKAIANPESYIDFNPEDLDKKNADLDIVTDRDLNHIKSIKNVVNDSTELVQNFLDAQTLAALLRKLEPMPPLDFTRLPSRLEIIHTRP